MSRKTKSLDLREIVMAIQKKSLNSRPKDSKRTKATVSRGPKPKSTIRGGKEVSLKLSIEKLPAVQ
jgi:hypothetical protein